MQATRIEEWLVIKDLIARRARAPGGPINHRGPLGTTSGAQVRIGRWSYLLSIGCGAGVLYGMVQAAEITGPYSGNLAEGDNVTSTESSAGWTTGSDTTRHLTAAGNNIVTTSSTRGRTMSSAVQAYYGGSLTAQDITIFTTGDAKFGVQAGVCQLTGCFGGELPTYDGTVNLNRATISTDGYVAGGVVAWGYRARVTLDNTLVTVRGDGLELSDVSTSAAGVGGTGGAQITMTNSSSTTFGTYSPALLLQTALNGQYGFFTAANVDATTSGTGSSGFVVLNRDAGTYASVDDVRITTKGREAYGVYVQEGDFRVLSGGLDIKTEGQAASGLRSRYGTSTTDFGAVTSISTKGVGAFGIHLTEQANVTGTSGSRITINTAQDEARGIVAQTGVVTLSNASIHTLGANASGLDIAGTAGVNSGSPTVGTATLTGSEIVTSGQGAHGVYAHDHGKVTLTDSTVETSGAQGHGLLASGTGTRLGEIEVSGTTVTTHKDGAMGASIGSNGQLTSAGTSSFETFGAGAHALEVTGSNDGTPVGVATLSNTQLITRGENSAGVRIAGGTLTAGTGVTVETHGTGGAGVLFDGPVPATAPVFDSSFRVHTYGADAHAITLRNGAVYTITGAPGTLAMSTLRVDGTNAAVLHAQDAGSQLTLGPGMQLGDADIGATALGAKAESGGTIVFTADSATGGAALWATGGTGAGTLRFQDDSSAAGSRVRVDDGGVLDASLRTTTLAVGSLAGASGGSVLLGGNTLELGGDGTSTRYGGAIAGTGGLTKVGTGVFTLAGMPAYQYTGATTLNGGVFRLDDIDDPTTFARTFTLNGGWLDLSEGGNPNTPPTNDWENLQFISGPNAAQGGVIGSTDLITFDVADGDTTIVDYDLGNETPALQGIYVVKTGPGTLDLTDDNTYVGNTRVLGGVLRVSRDSNLGNTAVGREVILNGGDLLIAGDVDARRRLLELRQSAVVAVDAGFTGTWAGVVDMDDCNCILTKDGAGTLALGAQTALYGVNLAAGSLTLNGGRLGGAPVAITADAATQSAVALDGADVTASPTAFSVSGGAQSSLAANASRLTGALLAEGAGSRADVTLAGGTRYTGVASQADGGQLAMTVADAASSWTVPSASSLQSLHNDGTVLFAADPAGYHNVVLAGGYSGSGNITFNTELNAGGALTDQRTNRLLVHGDVAPGTVTTVTVNPTGAGANTNTTNSDTFLPGQGISLIQVAGQSTQDAFQLAQHGRNYVAVAGSGYQYRLFAYGPGSPYGAPDPTQNAFDDGTARWDYRLQTACESRGGGINPCNESDEPPGPGPGPGPEPTPTRPLLLPQASSYLIAPLAFQRYGDFVTGNLHRRLGELRAVEAQGPQTRVETFGRIIGEHAKNRSSRDWQDYGHDFDQTNRALQVGANALLSASPTQQVRIGGAATFGSIKATPNVSGSGSSLNADAQTLSLIGTWRHAEGWYVDGIISGTRFSGSISTEGDRAARVRAYGLGASVEGGRGFTFGSGLQVTPYVQVLGQRLYSRDPRDKDGQDVDLGTQESLTARAAVRVGMPLKNTVSLTPYVTTGYSQTWGGTSDVTVARDASFATSRIGKSVFVGAGASGQITNALSLYGEVTRDTRIGGYGFSGTAATLGARFVF